MALIAGLRDVVSVQTSLLKSLNWPGWFNNSPIRRWTTCITCGSRKACPGQGHAKRLETMKDHRSAVASRSPIVVQESFERMKERIAKLLGTDLLIFRDCTRNWPSMPTVATLQKK